MTARALVAFASAMALTGSALAEDVKVFKFAEDPATIGTPQSVLGPRGPRLRPEGIFGFYDPATRQFTPARSPAPSASAAPETDSGTIKVEIIVHHGPGIADTDTVFCDPTFEFTPQPPSQNPVFIDSQYEYGRESNFAAGSASQGLTQSFLYRHVDPGGYVSVLLDCRVPNAISGGYYRAQVASAYYGLQPGSQALTVPVEIDF